MSHYYATIENGKISKVFIQDMALSQKERDAWEAAHPEFLPQDVIPGIGYIVDANNKAVSPLVIADAQPLDTKGTIA